MNRRNLLIGAAGITASALLVTNAEAAVPLVFLGRRKVNPLLDLDTIHVGASQGLFRKVQFHVSGNDLYLYNMNVTYANGAHDDIPTNFKIGQGKFSRVIDLRHHDRKIEKVTFAYGKLPNGRGATHIELWGWR
jgi:hypothetical protein